MDDVYGIIAIAIVVGIMSLVIMPDVPILTFLSNAFLGTSIASLAYMILIEVKHGWNDDMLASYAFLESLILIALGFRYLVQRHDAQHDAMKR